MDINAVMDKVRRLARLDTTVFDEVRDDQQELVPAIVVAAVAFLLAGLGTFLWWTVVTDAEPDTLFLNTVILGTIFAIVLYAVAALAVYVVMAQMYRVTVDLQSLVRTMGYAAIPMALSVLMLVPVIWPVFALVPLALLFWTMTQAVRSATNAEEDHVVIATLIGFSVMVLVLGLISLSTSGGDAPMGAGVFGTLYDFTL